RRDSSNHIDQRHASTKCSLYKANSATARITQAKMPTPNAGVKPWMGKRNPVTLVSAVVKRNNAVVIGNLCEANIPHTTISQLQIATIVKMTCKLVKAPTYIPRITKSSRCWPTRRKLKSVPPWLQLQQGFAAAGMGSGVGLRGINPAPPDVSYGSMLLKKG